MCLHQKNTYLIYSLQSSTCLGRNCMSTCPSRHREMDNIRSTWITQLQVLSHDIWSLTLSPNNPQQPFSPSLTLCQKCTYIKSEHTNSESTLGHSGSESHQSSRTMGHSLHGKSKGSCNQSIVVLCVGSSCKLYMFFLMFQMFRSLRFFSDGWIGIGTPKNCKSPRQLLPKSLMIAPRAKTRRHAKENHLHLWNWMTEWLENKGDSTGMKSSSGMIYQLQF